MKALKRPMFRMGGPIKEGIMDGMKEPQAFNTVGSPVFPKDASGRSQYALPAVLLAAARFAPAAMRGFRAARLGNYAPMSQNLGVMGRLKNIFSPGKGLSAAVGKAGPMPVAAGEGLGFRVGSLAKQNPLLALSTPSLAYDAARVGGPLLGEAAKGVANFLVPGKALDPFKDKKPEDKKTDDTGLEVVNEFGEQKKGGEAVSEETKNQITKDRIEENRKKYYKLMGIDKMKKDATYDSLIDASRIIQEQGGDLKGAVKSGALQNAIIQAISKNLDKSADLKKQIDAAILKGEIEKDIKSADTVDKRLKEQQIKRLERDEKQNTTASKIAAVQIEKGAVTGADTEAILRADGIEYTGTLPDDEFLKFKKNNKGKDERDFLIEKYGRLDDGKYIIGGRLVEKRGNNVAFAI